MVLQWKGADSREESKACLAAGADLDGIPLSGTARVAKIEAQDVLRRHLLELGFTEGSAVTYLMPTPFGDPKVFRLRGASIALRRSEARCIRVTP